MAAGLGQVNKLPGSPRAGQSFKTVGGFSRTGRGGTFHVYANGQRIFVPGGRGLARAAGPGGLAQKPAPGDAANQAAPPAAAGSEATPQPSPLDSTYFANVSGQTNRVGAEINALNQQSGYARTDLQKALSSLTQQQPIAEQNTENKYNAQGLLYSGHLGQALGQLGQSYADKQTQLNANFTRGQASRDARIAGLRQGLDLYTQTQGEDAAARAERAAAGDPTAGAIQSLADAISAGSSGGAPPAAPAAPATTAQAHAAAFRDVRVKGGAWHIYPNGRRVFVKGGR